MKDVAKGGEEREKDTVGSAARRGAYRKPWGLVVGIVLFLAASAYYIWWTNSPTTPSEAAASEAAVPVSEVYPRPNPAATKDVADPPKYPAGHDSLPPTTEVAVGEAAETSRAPEPSSREVVYVVNAGEFGSRGAAQRRVEELRQGDFEARVVAPDGDHPSYRVVAGEYRSRSAAQRAASSIGFILEISTSVEERVR